MDLFEPGSGSQVHDYNGGIPKNGLFWTVQLPGSAFGSEGGRARLHARDVHVNDSFEFAGSNVVPAALDLDVWWEETGSSERLGSGDTVPATDPAAFRGQFAPARARGRVSGSGPGFAFTGQGNTKEGYAELGFQRNGNFL
jgi:hypothetical protein